MIGMRAGISREYPGTAERGGPRRGAIPSEVSAAGVRPAAGHHRHRAEPRLQPHHRGPARFAAARPDRRRRRRRLGRGPREPQRRARQRREHPRADAAAQTATGCASARRTSSSAASTPAGKAHSKTTGVLRLCASAACRTRARSSACPNCEATEQTDDDTLTRQLRHGRRTPGASSSWSRRSSGRSTLGRVSDAERIVQRAIAQVEELLAAGGSIDTKALGGALRCRPSRPPSPRTTPRGWSGRSSLPPHPTACRPSRSWTRIGRGDRPSTAASCAARSSALLGDLERHGEGARRRARCERHRAPRADALTCSSPRAGDKTRRAARRSTGESGPRPILRLRANVRAAEGKARSCCAEAPRA